MTVLLCHHGTAESDSALDEAVRICLGEGRRLVVLLTAPPSWAGGCPGALDAGGQSGDEVWHRLAESEVPFEVHRFSGIEEIATAVLDMAARVGARLIVLGLGKSPGWSIGPCASRILLDAPCPVLTVNGAN